MKWVESMLAQIVRGSNEPQYESSRKLSLKANAAKEVRGTTGAIKNAR